MQDLIPSLMALAAGMAIGFPCLFQLLHGSTAPHHLLVLGNIIGLFLVMIAWVLLMRAQRIHAERRRNP